MWDLALGVATHVYNQSPHKTLNMKSPVSLFAPNHKFDLNQLERFGCLTYAKVTDKKLEDRAIKTFSVGYVPTGYIVFDPETKKLFEAREVRFFERYTCGDSYKAPKGLLEELKISRIDPDEKITEIGGDNSEGEMSETEGAIPEPPAKRKPGRPRKNEPVVLYTINNNEYDDEYDSELQSYESDVKYHALLASIMEDPKSCEEAINRTDSQKWKEAFDVEIKAMRDKKVFDLVKRPKFAQIGGRPTIIDTQWVCKTKLNPGNTKLVKARLVARGFRDTNFYDLRETYALVTRLPLIRLILAFANMFDLVMYQLEVKTAFLNSDVLGEIYTELPEEFPCTEKEKKECVWKLNKSLYGLRTSPKSNNNLFSEAMKDLGFKTRIHEPCLFIYRDKEILVLAVLYVDNVILVGNNESVSISIKGKLMARVEMKDLGEPKEYLGITISRDRKTKTSKLNQTKIINKMFNKFGYKDAYPQRSPMVNIYI